MTYRLYFHKRDGDDPVVWSIDEGTQDSEMHVQRFSLIGLIAHSRSNLDAKPGEPAGWIEVENAKARFYGGGVTLEPEVHRG
jgi:hypothetical protein